MATKVKKVALAYSGGLDTSCIIPWLKENYDGCDVIAVCADIGQGDELDVVREKALKSGASQVFIADLTEEFLTEYVWPTLKAGAVYEGHVLRPSRYRQKAGRDCPAGGLRRHRSRGDGQGQ